MDKASALVWIPAWENKHHNHEGVEILVLSYLDSNPGPTAVKAIVPTELYEYVLDKMVHHDSSNMTKHLVPILEIGSDALTEILSPENGGSGKSWLRQDMPTKTMTPSRGKNEHKEVNFRKKEWKKNWRMRWNEYKILTENKTKSTAQ